MRRARGGKRLQGAEAFGDGTNLESAAALALVACQTKRPRTSPPLARTGAELELQVLVHPHPFRILSLSSGSRTGTRTPAIDNALLPTDVCESIIDLCDFRQDFGGNPGDNYETLRACALVSTAWFPRSRRNLLREARLRNFDDVDLLLGLLQERPRLADLITAIYIPEHAYVPFARFPLSGGLRNCRRLTIDPDTWSRVYPPGYSRWISGFQTLTELVLGVSGLSAPEIFHIVWSLPLLSSLTLVESLGGSPRVQRFGARLAERLNAKSVPERCLELRHLTVDSSRYASLLSTAGFPPPGAFGSSVTHLDLRVSPDVVVSEHFLECLGSFSNLNGLAISVGESPSLFAQPSARYQDPRFGGSMFHLAAFPGPLSTADWTLPSSSVVGVEPLYTAVKTDNRTTGSGHTNEDRHEDSDERQAIRTTGTFQVEEKQDGDLRALQALQNPEFWKDMMMPGFQWPRMTDTTAPVLQIIPHIHSGRHFRELRMSLRPRNPIESYEHTRTSVLDALCGVEMQQALTRLPLIETFVLNIAEDETEYDAQWWTEQVVNRLPVLRGVVQIEQYRCIKYPAGPLWKPE